MATVNDTTSFSLPPLSPDAPPLDSIGRIVGAALSWAQATGNEPLEDAMRRGCGLVEDVRQGVLAARGYVGSALEPGAVELANDATERVRRAVAVLSGVLGDNVGAAVAMTARPIDEVEGLPSASPAVAQSVSDSIARAAAEAPSPAAFLELDRLLEKLLNVISHLRCADGVLFDLQAVPEPLQGAVIVLHDAIENLGALHTSLDEWAAKASREARYAGAAEATDALDAELPEALAQHLADQQDRARELADLLAIVLRDPQCNDNGVLTIARREAHALNEALDRASLCKALAGELS